jgi:hypothetical protein
VISSIVNKSGGFSRLLPDAKTALDEAIVRIRTLKDANCPVWKNIWKRYGECVEVVRFEVFSVVKIQIKFWVVMLCSVMAGC